MDEGGAPLAQRRTGRRADRRRGARREQSGAGGDLTQEGGREEGTPPPVAGSGTVPGRFRSGRGPLAGVEARIDAAVSDRAGGGGSGAAREGGTRPSSPPLPQHGPDVPAWARYEYLDHTADVQLHAWGDDAAGALEHLALAMFGYMTDLSSIATDRGTSLALAGSVSATGHDAQSLVYSFLDEWLYLFHESGFVPREVEVLGGPVDLGKPGKGGSGDLVVRSRGWGERMDLSRHPQGTEVKAITYSNLRVSVERGRCDLYVIVDI